MGAVAVVVHGIAGVVYGIDTMHVVHVTVAVVIGAVAGNFTRIHPHVAGQILVRVAHSGVDHRHDDVGRAVLRIPCILRVNVRAGRAAVNAGVVQPPKGTVVVTKIIRSDQRLHLEIRLRVLDEAASPEQCEHVVQARPDRQLDDLQIPDGRERVQDRCSQQNVQGRQV